MKKILLGIVFSMLITDFTYAIDRDNKWYVYWGWNRATYANSDISFKGNDHDFTLSDVQASDAPNPFSDLFSHYLNPSKLTIPQYNFLLGYYINNNIAISIGFDHLKYVVNKPQKVNISGTINDKKESGSKDLDGFLSYEHTNGYNILFLDVSYIDSFYSNDTLDISLFGGVGVGVVIPKSSVTLMNKKNRDEVHFAGVDVSIKVGSEITFSDSYLFRTTLKAGHSNMFDVLTTYDGGKAEQDINYLQLIWAFGYRF
jgi:hypothetical protein